MPKKRGRPKGLNPNKKEEALAKRMGKCHFSVRIFCSSILKDALKSENYFIL